MSYLDNFRYSFFGPEEGRPWIFLHGLMGTGANWQRIVTDLAKTERILTFDQRGHGRSFQPPTGYCPEDFANDLLKIITEIGWGQFILVGHSMGGRNALNFASRFPAKVTHLIIEDIGPEQKSEDIEYFKRLLGGIPTPFICREKARQFFGTEFSELGLVHDDPVMVGQFLYANLEEKEDGSLDWRFFKEGIMQAVICGRDRSRWDELRALIVPTLVMRGSKSKELSHETYFQMQASSPLIEGVEIPESGHWIHAEQPKAFLTAIKNFVGGF